MVKAQVTKSLHKEVLLKEYTPQEVREIKQTLKEMNIHQGGRRGSYLWVNRFGKVYDKSEDCTYYKVVNGDGIPTGYLIPTDWVKLIYNRKGKTIIFK